MGCWGIILWWKESTQILQCEPGKCPGNSFRTPGKVANATCSSTFFSLPGNGIKLRSHHCNLGQDTSGGSAETVCETEVSWEATSVGIQAVHLCAGTPPQKNRSQAGTWPWHAGDGAKPGWLPLSLGGREMWEQQPAELPREPSMEPLVSWDQKAKEPEVSQRRGSPSPSPPVPSPFCRKGEEPGCVLSLQACWSWGQRNPSV